MLKKKMVSLLLVLAMCLSLAVPTFAVGGNDSYVDAIKQSYIDDYCFYQITDSDYLDSLDDDDVIEVFHYIKVTKRLLDDNLILDINKVTKSDIIPECSPLSTQVYDTETRHTLSSSYDNVVVIKKLVAEGDLPGSEITSSLTYMYLSNHGIIDFVMADWSGSLDQPVEAAVIEWAACTLVGLESAGFGAFLSLALVFLHQIDASKEKTFLKSIENIYYAGGKAVVCMSIVKRSCEKWTDCYFYTEDGYRSGLDISSEYSCYNNRKVG